MKVSIQRNGIVIRTMTVDASRARIGSAPECEICLDDPYLSAHVADLVAAGDAYRIIDAGSSLEGVTLNGRRVEDEIVAPGSVYSIGAFEFVVDPVAVAATPSTSQPRVPSAQLPPTTVLPASLHGSPADAPRPVSAYPQGGGGSQDLTFVALAGAASEPKAASRPPSRRRLLLIVGCVLAVGIIAMLVVMISGGGSDTSDTSKDRTPTVAESKGPPAAPVDHKTEGERAFARLDYQAGLRHWEAAFGTGADSGLRERYARIAVDLGNAFAAKGDDRQARSYFEKAVTFGPADSPTVQFAKSRVSAVPEISR